VTRATVLALSIGLVPGCAVLAPPATDTVRIDHGSFRFDAPVAEDASIRIAEPVQLLGRFELAPVFEAEGRTASSVQVLMHDGSYYVAAPGFRNLWRLEPRPGTSTAELRPIRLPDSAVPSVRLSRYGPGGGACVRVDADGGGPWYVTGDGALRDACL